MGTTVIKHTHTHTRTDTQTTNLGMHPFIVNLPDKVGEKADHKDHHHGQVQHRRRVETRNDAGQSRVEARRRWDQRIQDCAPGTRVIKTRGCWTQKRKARKRKRCWVAQIRLILTTTATTATTTTTTTTATTATTTATKTATTKHTHTRAHSTYKQREGNRGGNPKL